MPGTKVATIFCALLLAACARQSSSQESPAFGGAAPAPVADAGASVANAGDQARAYLAYEHTVGVSLAADGIVQRLGEIKAACDDGRHGECVVLNVWQQGGDHPAASIGMRIVPSGVEPMIAQASAGADLGERSTRAEDLAVVVRDNGLAQDRLRKERARLEEFQARRDLAVADMIALSKQLAETQAQLEAAEQQGAQHRRRIETQLLTINLQPTSAQESRNDIVLALKDSGRTLASGVAWTIRSLAFLLPVLLVLSAVFALVRRWRRRKRG